MKWGFIAADIPVDWTLVPASGVVALLVFLLKTVIQNGNDNRKYEKHLREEWIADRANLRQECREEKAELERQIVELRARVSDLEEQNRALIERLMGS